MQGLKLLTIGIITGMLLGSGISYGYFQFSNLSNDIATKDNQIANLQAQITNLQKSLSENQEGTNPTQTPTKSPTPIPTQSTTANPHNNEPTNEKIEFINAYADIDFGTTMSNFSITIVLKNTGSTKATLDSSLILFNGKPATAYTDLPVINFTQITIQPEDSCGATIDLPFLTTNPSGNILRSGDWQSGMTVEIMLRTTSGKDYPKVVVLP